jgi:DNA-binding transcriptional LysR family regulator
MDRLTVLRIFVAVARFESFTRAADSLGMNRSCISRAIADLETRSNTRLFQRTTRRVCLTDAARDFFECCESVLAQIDAAESRLKSGRQQLSGVLRLVVHPSVAASDLPHILSGYKARAPHVGLEIVMSETRTDIVAGGYDVGLLPSHLIANARAISRLVRTSARILVASTPYLASHGRPRAVADLSGHSLMQTPYADRRSERRLVLRKGLQTHEVRMRSSLRVDDSVLLLCAIASMGIALVPAALAKDALQSGALEHVLPDYTVEGAQMEICLAYPSRELMSASSRAFIDYCIEFFAHRAASAEPRATSDADVWAPMSAPQRHLYANQATLGSAR